MSAQDVANEFESLKNYITKDQIKEVERLAELAGKLQRDRGMWSNVQLEAFEKGIFERAKNRQLKPTTSLFEILEGTGFFQDDNDYYGDPEMVKEHERLMKSYRDRGIVLPGDPEPTIYSVGKKK